MIARATVTTRSTVVTGSAVSDGHSCAAMTAATRKNAGAGTRSLALSRLDSTAAVPTKPITRTMTPNWLSPLIGCSSPGHPAQRVKSSHLRNPIRPPERKPKARVERAGGECGKY